MSKPSKTTPLTTTLLSAAAVNPQLDFFTGDIDPMQVLITLALSFAIGLFIYFIYKKTFSGIMYSRSFNLSLLVLSMVTAMVIMLVSSNLALSLGMVGALSIVRFRTAIKDPIDTVFMFWAVGVGIALGAGFYGAAIIASLLIGFAVVIMTLAKLKSAAPYLLVLHYSEVASQQVKGLVKQLPKSRLKSKTVQHDSIEMTIELRIRTEDAAFVEKFLQIDGMYDASLISYQGDILT